MSALSFVSGTALRFALRDPRHLSRDHFLTHNKCRIPDEPSGLRFARPEGKLREIWESKYSVLCSPLSKPAHWLWLTERADSPWYPSVCLFRPRGNDEWSYVFDAAAAELMQLAQRNSDRPFAEQANATATGLKQSGRVAYA